MKIALIGATGYVGSALFTELLDRKYQVKALVLDPSSIKAGDNLEIIQIDVMHEDSLVSVLEDVDIVVSAFNPGWANPNICEDYLKGSRSILNAVKRAKVKRILIVGGAGSLYVAPGVQIIDTPEFPKEYFEGANGPRILLDELKKETQLDWTMISPPIGFSPANPGVRTGTYRLGTDSPLMNENQPGTISAEDLAIALIDEMEQKKFACQRFTVAY
ncbi:NAD(P)-dependent oxidoreductase [Acinetobacter guillouiae]|uniref:NAD(P)-dependent oxidoreductase n=1 Tax=Acinetobacter TaxID=469 RepID=UPI0021C59045|nr:NAD(P)H-binding protein [Acinetobacter sp. I-MWF]MCT9976962.1 NAD(P)H-binding protein [Acinetobacter sp. I-MWF]